MRIYFDSEDEISLSDQEEDSADEDEEEFCMNTST